MSGSLAISKIIPGLSQAQTALQLLREERTRARVQPVRAVQSPAHKTPVALENAVLAQSAEEFAHAQYSLSASRFYATQAQNQQVIMPARADIAARRIQSNPNFVAQVASAASSRVLDGNPFRVLA
jgi:hypothetical protein